MPFARSVKISGIRDPVFIAFETASRNVATCQLYIIVIVPWSYIQTYGGVKKELHAFWTSALEDGRSASRLGHVTTGEKTPPCPLSRRLSELQSRSGGFEEGKNL